MKQQEESCGRVKEKNTMDTQRRRDRRSARTCLGPLLGRVNAEETSAKFVFSKCFLGLVYLCLIYVYLSGRTHACTRVFTWIPGGCFFLSGGFYEVSFFVSSSFWVAH